MWLHGVFGDSQALGEKPSMGLSKPHVGTKRISNYARTVLHESGG